MNVSSLSSTLLLLLTPLLLTKSLVVMSQNNTVAIITILSILARPILFVLSLSKGKGYVGHLHNTRKIVIVLGIVCIERMVICIVVVAILIYVIHKIVLMS